MPDHPVANTPATLRIQLTIPANETQRFEQLAKGMGAAATGVGEATSVDVISLPPQGDNARRLVAVQFQSHAALEQWRASYEAAVWRAGLENVAVERPALQVRNGVEVWFSSSATQYAAPPAPWKMALLSILGLYPTLLALNGLLEPLLRSAPEWLNALLSTCILSALITWPIMPLLTKIFHRWLYPTLEADA